MLKKIMAWVGLPARQVYMLLFCGVCVCLAQWDQPFPQLAPLHHAPTVIVLISIPFVLNRWPISDTALACIIVFFLLHTLGGRYTYTNTPYDDWSMALTGFELSEVFGWQRNHFDRLVHFSFGLFSVYPVQYVLKRYARVSAALAIYVALEFVMGISAIYEILEWILSLLLAGDAVESYNGQQGDIWDAQKDMALALLGAIVAALTYVIASKRLETNV